MQCPLSDLAEAIPQTERIVEKATLTSQQFSLEAVKGNDRLKVQVSFSESQSKRLKSQ